MAARMLVIALLLFLGPGLLLAGCSNDDEGIPTDSRRFARFDYAVRVSMVCRQANLRLDELSSTGSAARVAARWRSVLVRFQRDVRAERFPAFVSVQAGELLAAVAALKGSVASIARGDDTRPVGTFVRGIRQSGARLRALGKSMGASACERVDAGAERRLLPALSG